MQDMNKDAILEQDINKVFNSLSEYWSDFSGKTILVTGATGAIGSFLIKSLLRVNEETNYNIKTVALVRDVEKAKRIFGNNSAIEYITQDIKTSISYNNSIDYIIHCANNTNSQSFVDYPLESLDVAISGTKNILEFAYNKKVKSIVFLSSMEVYGELSAERGMTKETDYGYIDILKPRSSYQVGKKTAEAYCSGYSTEKNLPVKIVRLAQVVTPTVNYNDERVFAYFARSIAENKDIILKTTGEVVRSFCYITDAITAILTVLLKGKNGEAYNIACPDATKSIRDIATLLTQKYNLQTIFEIEPNTKYPAKTNWQLDINKIRLLGWQPETSFNEMFERIINSFLNERNSKE